MVSIRELEIASNWCKNYAAMSLSASGEQSALKHCLNVASTVLPRCELKIYKKNDGFFFQYGNGTIGYLSPFEGLLWRFFEVIPKRLFPYKIEEITDV